MYQISSGGIVIHDDKILVLKKNNGFYCIPKGRIEKGETKEQAALREVKEESNIDGEIIDYIGKINYHYVREKRLIVINKEVHWFLMKALTLDAKPQHAEGFAEAIFIPIDDVFKLMTYKDERKMIGAAVELYRKLK